MKSQENCKFQCLRFLNSYACLRNKECYECHKLEHRELLERYEGIFQIRVFAPLGRVSILQITIISQFKHIAKYTATHIHQRGARRYMCSDPRPCFANWGGGCAPPTPPPPLFRNASTMQNKTTYERSRSRCVLIFVHASQIGGGLRPRTL